MSDAHDLYKLARELENIAIQIEAIGPELAKAKVVDRFDSDRRKNLLAEFTKPHLDGGSSSSAAETHARADVMYQVKLKELGQQLNVAMATITKESGLQARLEAARSIMSMTKAQMQL